MRFIVALAAAGCLTATAALAQEVSRLTWDRQPDAMAFARHYPQRAIDDSVEGAAVVCCTLNPDRTLSCRAPLEWPAGYGFGEATLAVASELRMSEQSYKQVRADPSYVVRRTFRWALPGGPRDLPAAFRDAAPHACDGPAVPGELISSDDPYRCRFVATTIRACVVGAVIAQEALSEARMHSW